jgi:hypothetical protein
LLFPFGIGNGALGEVEEPSFFIAHLAAEVAAECLFEVGKEAADGGGAMAVIGHDKPVHGVATGIAGGENVTGGNEDGVCRAASDLMRHLVHAWAVGLLARLEDAIR